MAENPNQIQRNLHINIKSSSNRIKFIELQPRTCRGIELRADLRYKSLASMAKCWPHRVSESESVAPEKVHKPRSVLLKDFHIFTSFSLSAQVREGSI